MKQLVSVIINTYNYGHFIEQAIESVLNQDFPKDQMEIIVVDDGSTDDTESKVKKYPQIKYIYQQNKGQAAAFNTGFANAQGEMICLLDADDYWYPDKIKIVYEIFKKYPDGGLFQHPSHYVDITGRINEREIPKLPEFYTIKHLLNNNVSFYGTSNLSFRRKFLKNLMPVPEEMGNFDADQYLYYNILFYSKVYNINIPLAAHRIHTSNWYARRFENIKALEMHIKVLEKVNLIVDKKAKELNLIKEKQKLYPNSLIDIVREKVIFFRMKKRLIKAIESLFELSKIKINPFVIFKALTLFIALISPKIYLKLFVLYSKKPLLPKLRKLIFP